MVICIASKYTHLDVTYIVLLDQVEGCKAALATGSVAKPAIFKDPGSGGVSVFA